MLISHWLQQASNDLADAMFPSALLDAEIILAHTLRRPRTWLHAHSDEQISLRDEEIANARIELRKDHVPVAYIIGHKEFYGRRFYVSPSVLIPRPESEQLITHLKQLLPQSAPLPGVDTKRLVDIGTGSGCLGITAKLEFPDLNVTLVDNKRHVKATAERNARLHNADVTFLQSDLLNDYPYEPDIVLANLPYVDQTWEQSEELQHEPADALFAANNGLAVIQRCIEQCQVRIAPNGLLLLEADTRQLDAILTLAKKHGLHEIARDSFTIALRKT